MQDSYIVRIASMPYMHTIIAVQSIKKANLMATLDPRMKTLHVLLSDSEYPLTQTGLVHLTTIIIQLDLSPHVYEFSQALKNTLIIAPPWVGALKDAMS